MAPEIQPSPTFAPDGLPLHVEGANRAAPALALVARASRLPMAFARAPGYLNEPNETARPRDEAAFTHHNRAPRLDEIEGATWEPDRWRE